MSAPPQRVLIHWLDDDARRPTLAVAASLLRHVAAEAVYVGIMPEGASESQRPFGVRTLLDARSEAQAVHGLEMRTELRFGVAAEELQRQLSETPDQMLILGISDLKQFRSTFASSARGAHDLLVDGRLPSGRAVSTSEIPDEPNEPSRAACAQPRSEPLPHRCGDALRRVRRRWRTAKSITLLNVSYDPTREFYRDINSGFC